MAGEVPTAFAPGAGPGSGSQRLAARAHAWPAAGHPDAARMLHAVCGPRLPSGPRFDDGFAFDPGLVSASPEAFRRQMIHLREHFHPVTCREVVAALDGGPPLPRDAVLVTFDDGYDDNHAFAFPILRETGVPATFFVATGHIDSGLPTPMTGSRTWY